MRAARGWANSRIQNSSELRWLGIRPRASAVRPVHLMDFIAPGGGNGRGNSPLPRCLTVAGGAAAACRRLACTHGFAAKRVGATETRGSPCSGRQRRLRLSLRSNNAPGEYGYRRIADGSWRAPPFAPPTSIRGSAAGHPPSASGLVWSPSLCGCLPQQVVVMVVGERCGRGGIALNRW